MLWPGILMRCDSSRCRTGQLEGQKKQRAIIACLAGPSGTVASHLTAAALFGLAKSPAVPQVTIAPGAGGRFRGARPFRAQLSSGEICLRRRIRCTTPARTIIDCAAAGLVDAEELCDLVDSALCKKREPSDKSGCTTKKTSSSPEPMSESGN